jgi:hypothetical protein
MVSVHLFSFYATTRRSVAFGISGIVQNWNNGLEIHICLEKFHRWLKISTLRTAHIETLGRETSKSALCGGSVQLWHLLWVLILKWQDYVISDKVLHFLHLQRLDI